MTIRPVGAKLFHEDRRTKLIVAFRNSDNEPKKGNGMQQSGWSQCLLNYPASEETFHHVHLSPWSHDIQRQLAGSNRLSREVAAKNCGMTRFITWTRRHRACFILVCYFKGITSHNERDSEELLSRLPAVRPFHTHQVEGASERSGYKNT
jgi:hypothetical protein